MTDFLIFFGCMVALVVFGVAVMLRRGLEMKKLAQEGQSVQAIVIKKARVRRKGSNPPAITYEFQDSFGKTHQRRIFVSESFYERHQEGGTIEVVYLLDKPEVNAAKTLVEEVKKAL